MMNNMSSAGLAKNKLFEYENNRWACLGWKSYGGGQLLEYVREYGDYQVGLNSALTSFYGRRKDEQNDGVILGLCDGLPEDHCHPSRGYWHDR